VPVSPTPATHPILLRKMGIRAAFYEHSGYWRPLAPLSQA
jgi:hypothetical protein